MERCRAGRPEISNGRRSGAAERLQVVARRRRRRVPTQADLPSILFERASSWSARGEPHVRFASKGAAAALGHELDAESLRGRHLRPGVEQWSRRVEAAEELPLD